MTIVRRVTATRGFGLRQVGLRAAVGRSDFRVDVVVTTLPGAEDTARHWIGSTSTVWRARGFETARKAIPPRAPRVHVGVGREVSVSSQLLRLPDRQPGIVETVSHLHQPQEPGSPLNGPTTSVALVGVAPTAAIDGNLAKRDESEVRRGGGARSV